MPKPVVPEKNFISHNIEKLRYLKPVEHRPWSQQGNFKVSTDGFNRPNSMLSNFRRKSSGGKAVLNQT